MITLFNWSIHGGQKEDKTLQHSQHRCKGELRHINLQLLETTVDMLELLYAEELKRSPSSVLKFYTTWITRYQMHQQNVYCKRKPKCSSGTFVTRSSFKFPHQACESAKLNSEVTVSSHGKSFINYPGETPLCDPSAWHISPNRRLVNPNCSLYHARLQMLEARSNIKRINEVRHADGEDQQRWQTTADGRLK